MTDPQTERIQFPPHRPPMGSGWDQIPPPVPVANRYRAPLVTGPQFREEPGKEPSWELTPGQITEFKPMEIAQAHDLSTGERALSVVKNVVVIVTCLAILYALWRLNVGIEAFKEGFADFANSFNNLGN